MASARARPEIDRLRTAAELHDLGVAIKRQNLRRQHTSAEETEIERLLGAWLRERPPDAPGRPGAWPRGPR